MKVYLMRHAHSEDGDPMDDSRELTKRGRKQCKRMRRFLRHSGVKLDAVFSSQLARSIDTADLMNRKFGAPMYQLDELDPDSTPEDAWRAIAAEMASTARILVVTHDPLIQPMLTSVCFGFADWPNLFDHANIACFDTAAEAPGPGEQAHQFKWFIGSKEAKRAIKESGTAAAMELAEASIELAEHLKRKSRRRIIDPLVNWMRKRVAERFRRQGREIIFRHGAFILPQPPAIDYNQICQAAYVHGAQYCAQMLGVPVTEAKRKKAVLLPLLPGVGEPDRTDDDLEREIDATTREKLSEIVADLGGKGDSEDQINDAIKAQFRDWQKQRSESIAEYEVSTAYHNGMSDTADGYAQSTGASVEKQWSADPDACPICEENAELEWIPIDQSFPSGVDEPPQHPNCRCSIEYREQ